jgi:hypothetical protein
MHIGNLVTIHNNVASSFRLPEDISAYRELMHLIVALQNRHLDRAACGKNK